MRSRTSLERTLPGRTPLQAVRQVTKTLSAFDKHQAVLVPGRASNRMRAFATRLFPRAMIAKIAETGSRKVMTAGQGRTAR